MTTDWDVCEKLSLDELNELKREIGTVEWHIEHLKTKLGELGFDMKQYSMDLLYFCDELWELIMKKERREEE